MSNSIVGSAEAILKALRDRGVPQRVIAEKLAIPQSAVSNMYKGGRRLKFEEAKILMEMLPPAPTIVELPLIGLAGAGNWIEAVEDARDTVQVPSQLAGKAKFAVEVVGDSMNLVLAEGSYAVIDPTDLRLFVGKIYLLRNGEGDATIKRYRSDPARFEPVSDNPEYQPFELGTLDFRVIGRVVAAVQKF